MTTPVRIPRNDDAERAVLGACLQSADAVAQARAILAATDFYSEPHRELFRAIETLSTEGRPVDLVTVADALLHHAGDRLHAVGGPASLAALVDAVPTAAHVATHAEIVKRHADWRRLLEVATGLRERACTGDAEPAAIARDVQEQLLALGAQPRGHSLLVPVADLQAPPLTFTVQDLLPAGMLTLLSGRDKLGKTLLAQEILRAVLRGDPLLGRFPTTPGSAVGVFLDDPLALTLDRLSALEIRTDPRLRVVDPVAYDGNGAQLLERLEPELRALRPTLVVIDALYLLVPPGRDAGNDQGRMMPVMVNLNRLADVTGAAVLLVAHDNKTGSDVAGSHVIRAAAKSILRLTRPDPGQLGEETAGPATEQRVLHVESKFAGATTYTLRIRGVGAWEYLDSDRSEPPLSTPDAVRAYLAQGGTGTVQDITTALGRRRTDVAAALATLVQEGAALRQERKGGTGRPAIVYCSATQAGEFPSGASAAPGAQNGPARPELAADPGVSAARTFPSQAAAPRDRRPDGKAKAAAVATEEEVEEWDPLTA